MFINYLDKGIFFQVVNCIPEKYNDLYTSSYKNYDLVVCITMYNESKQMFLNTFNSLVNNVKYFTKKSNAKILICIIADGRSKIDPEVLEVLTLLGVYIQTPFYSEGGYQFEALVKHKITNKKLKPLKIPVNCLFFLKEHNLRKINSHRWLFNAFAKSVKAEFTILVDVGTILDKQSIYEIFTEFKSNKNVAGVCGEIYVEFNKGNFWKPLVAAQNFEYKISNILDKPFENTFGYISVLPGAFSAYRYSAVEKVLDVYLKGEHLHTESSMSVFLANMYLAEDRILCFHLLTQENEKYQLRYIQSARAKTDVPDNLSELISQRRRWLNGSFFATIYSIVHFYKIFNSDHSYFNKFLFCFQSFFNFFVTFVSYFQVSLFYISFYFVVKSFLPELALVILNSVYLGITVVLFLASLGNKPQGMKIVFRFATIVFSGFMILCIFIITMIIVETISGSIKNFQESENIPLFLYNEYFRNILLSIISIFGIYTILGFFYLDLFSVLFCLIQYHILIPVYINIFQIFSVCNINDISWGTKGNSQNELSKNTSITIENNCFPTSQDYQMMIDNYSVLLDKLKYKQHKDKVSNNNHDDHFRAFRTYFIFIYIILNLGVSVIFTHPYVLEVLKTRLNTEINPYLIFILFYVVVINTVKFLGSLFYIITFRIKKFFRVILNQCK